METVRTGDPGGAAEVADNPFEPFLLAASILETARLCLLDREGAKHPLCLVIPRGESGRAVQIWNAVAVVGSGVVMELEPDQGGTKWSVMLFQRQEARAEGKRQEA